MKRILLVLTVAALMAARMLSAGPAKADVSGGGNSSNFSSGGVLSALGAASAASSSIVTASALASVEDRQATAGVLTPRLLYPWGSS